MGLGQNLRFSRDDNISWSPQIAHGRAASRFPELDAALRWGHARPDPRLLNVWADMREFSEIVNGATARGAKVAVATASRLAESVPHRLLHLGLRDAAQACQSDNDLGVLRFRAESLHEFLRLCMLAYAKMLLIKLQGIGKKMKFLADGLRTVLRAWHADVQHRKACDDVLGDAVDISKLLLWGTFITAVSIFEDLEEEWIVEVLGQALCFLGLRTWDETRVVLKGFLWIDAVFDDPARMLFQRLSVCVA